MIQDTENKPSLAPKIYRTVASVNGPLIMIEQVSGVGYNELVDLMPARQDARVGQVLEVDGDRAVVQVFAGTRGLGLENTQARFTGDVARLAVSRAMLGRVFDGAGRPIDGGPPVVSQMWREISGLPINPTARAYPSASIRTGFAAIDGLTTLVRGQKLPIFTGSGLPANELAARIAAQASVANTDEPFVVVFAAIGITHREASFFLHAFEASGALEHSVLFLNLADEPTVERLLTPRVALTCAEYLAFEYDMHVLVILTDMTNYAEALREVANAREEIPGRRGYPGYLYTDLATLYERAGCIQGQAGSITQLIILSMPEDDITHPIPDLTGYITEGQIVLSRELHRKGIFPPIDVLPSLSRLMNAGIGAGKTRADHRDVAAQLYAQYAQGRDLRRLVAIIGERALGEDDRRRLAFADAFEREFIHQGDAERSLDETLAIAWRLLSAFPPSELKRIRPEYIDQYYQTGHM
jgi:V/A-type H+/Na+-transporting ATPase subunit B